MGIIHDGNGSVVRLDERQRAIVEAVVAIGKSAFDFANYNRFQRNLASGRPNEWHCGAGCRYLYICEDGLVHWCSQQRGRPGIPLERFGPEDLRREYHTVKSCAPFCTVGCVHRVAQIDELRRDPQEALVRWFGPSSRSGSTATPTAIRLLRWAFVTSHSRNRFRHAAAWLFGVRRT
jgi:hypothetical protein